MFSGLRRFYGIEIIICSNKFCSPISFVIIPIMLLKEEILTWLVAIMSSRNNIRSTCSSCWILLWNILKCPAWGCIRIFYCDFFCLSIYFLTFMTSIKFYCILLAWPCQKCKAVLGPTDVGKGMLVLKNFALVHNLASVHGRKGECLPWVHLSFHNGKIIC